MENNSCENLLNEINNKSSNTQLNESVNIKKKPKGMRFKKRQPKKYNIDKLFTGILKNNRAILAQAITLIESNSPEQFNIGQQLLNRVLPYSGHSLRIGITGVPGAGKSTFIESFGTFLCEKGYKVVVLAIDPSSTVTGGSILGDKTRMEKLSRNELAFIRPSPSEGKLGGVHRKTRETMLLCEAAGYDVIIIETVGVGQSEVLVRGMVDFFLLLTITGAGDELQGMKKGVIELADAIVVNKADGDNVTKAIKTKVEFNRILNFLQSASTGWKTRAYTCSAIEGKGIAELWNVIKKFEKETKINGTFINRRHKQTNDWLKSLISEQLEATFYNDKKIKELLPHLEKEVMAGEITVTSAIEQLFQVFTKK